MKVLDELNAEVTADPDSVALILHGSRAAGVHGPGSDYELVRVVTDDSYAVRRELGQLREKRPGPAQTCLGVAPGRRARRPDDDQLRAPLVELERAQGWAEGFLADALIRVLATADPTFQQALELRVEALMDSCGTAHRWGPEDDLEPAKAHRLE